MGCMGVQCNGRLMEGMGGQKGMVVQGWGWVGTGHMANVCKVWNVKAGRWVR